jgi:hypothetical protein
MLPVRSNADSVYGLRSRPGEAMKMKFAALVAAAIAFTSTPVSAQVCGIGIIAAAFVANFKDNRELTSKEAQTCGLLLGQDKANEKPAKAKKNPKPS